MTTQNGLPIFQALLDESLTTPPNAGPFGDITFDPEKFVRLEGSLPIEARIHWQMWISREEQVAKSAAELKELLSDPATDPGKITEASQTHETLSWETEIVEKTIILALRKAYPQYGDIGHIHIFTDGSLGYCPEEQEMHVADAKSGPTCGLKQKQ